MKKGDGSVQSKFSKKKGAEGEKKVEGEEVTGKKEERKEQKSQEKVVVKEEPKKE